MSTDAAILARLAEMERTAAERHAELLAALARVNDAATCADLTAGQVLRVLHDEG